jgi:xanthine dehydrogenase accessory factor
MQHGLNTIETRQVKHIHYGTGSPYMDLKLRRGGALELVIDPEPNLNMLCAALKTLHGRDLATLSFAPEAGLVPSGQGGFQFQYAPKPALLVAGRGAILRTTASLAASMGFELHLASPDEDDITSLAGLRPKNTHRMTTPNVPLKLPIDAHTAVLLLFHDHEWEHTLLINTASVQPFFMGVLGRRKTQEIRLQRLLEAGLDLKLCSTIQGPIGLVPSLCNASLIAISALAEVTPKLPPAEVRLL